jgi:hypothetical protein
VWLLVQLLCCFFASQVVLGHLLGQVFAPSAFGQVPAFFFAAQQALSQSAGQPASLAAVPLDAQALACTAEQALPRSAPTASSSQPVSKTTPNKKAVTRTADINNILFDTLRFIWVLLKKMFNFSSGMTTRRH